MKLLLHNLFAFDRDETAGEILFYRLFESFLVYMALFYAWSWGFYLQRISDVVLPLGIARYIDISFMFDHHLGLVNAGLITGLLLLGYFRGVRIGYLGAILLLHVQYAARYCLGEISHGSTVVMLCLFLLGMATLAFDARRDIRRAGLGLCYFFVGLGYTSAAFCKLIGTGPGWVDGQHLWLWIAERTVDTFSMSGVIATNWVQTLALEHYAVATLILAFGLLTEFFGFLVWFRRTRPYIITLLIIMHVGIVISMKIFFASNTFALVFLAYPWGRLIDISLGKLDVVRSERIRRLSLLLT